MLSIKLTIYLHKYCICSANRNSVILHSSSFERPPLQVRHKQDWGQGLILLLPQTAALPESDAGSGVIKASIEFHHPKPSDLVLHVVPDV